MPSETRTGAQQRTARVALTDGLLGRWQQRNTAATLPHVVEQVRASGVLDNFRRIAEQTDEPFRGGYPFMDTDVYKTLEAAAYELARVAAPGESPGDAAVRAFYEEAVALIERAQADDGYLSSFHQGPRRDGPAVDRPGRRARAVQPGPPGPGGARRRAHPGRPAAARGRPPVRGPRGGPVRRGRPGGVLRPPADRDGARRAVSRDGPRALPAPGRAVRRAPRLGALRRGAVRSRVLRGPRAAARPGHGDRACRAHGLPGGRRHRRRHRARRHRPDRPPAPPVGRHGAHQVLRHGRDRVAALGRGVRRPVRAAFRTRLRRDVRGHRDDAVGLAAVPGHRERRGPGPRGACPLQRVRRGRLAGRHPLLLRQPAAAPSRPHRRTAGRPRGAAAQAVVRLCLLPAERGALDQRAPEPCGARDAGRPHDRAAHRVPRAFGPALRRRRHRLPLGRADHGPRARRPRRARDADAPHTRLGDDAAGHRGRRTGRQRGRRRDAGRVAAPDPRVAARPAGRARPADAPDARRLAPRGRRDPRHRRRRARAGGALPGAGRLPRTRRRARRARGRRSPSVPSTPCCGMP